MNILFVHQNFPGQFQHLAVALAAQPGHRILALHVNATPALPGVQMVRYPIGSDTTPGVHRWLIDLETKVIRGEAAYLAAKQLKQNGFSPDVIVAHPGWGESLFLKDLWPAARLGIYCEFFYHATGADFGFDPEFSNAPLDDACRLRMKNASDLLHFSQAEGGLSPTHWQRSVFPQPFRSRITVIHDGIDTRILQPDPQARLALKTGNGPLALSGDDEIITFVSRNLEPYRGYHIFMRSLAAILKARPKARVLIVGNDGVSYGKKPAPASQSGQFVDSWKAIFLNEVKAELDMQRVHFLGFIPRPQFISLLQLSTVHVYLTYPFVLSWSLLEAMSVGCAIVASHTAPLHEAIEHGKTGRLVDFFDVTALSDNVIDLCAQAQERQRLGQAARQFAIENYDLHTRCLPGQMAWVRSLVA